MRKYFILTASILAFFAQSCATENTTDIAPEKTTSIEIEVDGGDLSRTYVDNDIIRWHETGEQLSIIYFADEELDEFKDRDAESYTSEEIEMFEEVFFTLRENELVDWLKSLQLRHVPLPPAIKEQALMIIAERRKEPAID